VFRKRTRRVGLLAVSAFVLHACGEANAQEDWRTLNSSRQADGEDMLRVAVEYGAGTLSIGSGEAGMLYNARVHYDAETFRPVVTYADSRLRLGVEGGSSRGGRNIRAGELDLKLSPEVPVELELKFGAADAKLDLGGLRVRRLDIQTGASRTMLSVPEPNLETCRFAQIQVGAARFEGTGLGNLNAERLSVQGGVGEVTLDFTGAWASGMTANIEMGLGSLTLRMPRGLGVRVTRVGRLASFDSEGLTKRGDSYYSANWDAGDANLSLDIKAALGSIRVVWVDS
jgi:hypothetical protein